MGLSYTHDGPVSANLLYRAYLAAQVLGARQPILLDAMQLSDAELRNPLAHFHPNSVTALCRAAYCELQDPNICSNIGRLMLPGGFSDPGFTAMFEQTFGEALLAALGAFELGNERLLFHLECSDHADTLILDVDDFIPMELVHLVIANIVNFGQALAGRGQPTVKAIYFTHPRPPGFEEFEDIWGPGGKVRCYFDQQFSCLEYYPRFFNRVNPRYNAPLIAARNRQKSKFRLNDTKQPSLTKINYSYLVYLLDKSGLNLDSAAESFGIAERTMRRKLVAEGSSFRRVLEHVRKDTCQLYFLEGTRSLSGISAKLGYSELSAFTRAYTAWYGHPPSRDLRHDMPEQDSLVA